MKLPPLRLAGAYFWQNKIHPSCQILTNLALCALLYLLCIIVLCITSPSLLWSAQTCYVSDAMPPCYSSIQSIAYHPASVGLMYGGRGSCYHLAHASIPNYPTTSVLLHSINHDYYQMYKKDWQISMLLI